MTNPLPPFSRRRFGALVTAATLGGFARQVGAATRWRLATPYPEGNFQTLSTQFFAEDLARESQGRLAIDVYPNDSLVPFGSIAPAVMGNQLELGEIQLSWLGPWLAAAEVDSVPFLAADYAQARQLWAASRPIFQRLFSRLNLVLLKAVPWPPVGLATRQRLAEVGELAGRRFLVTSPITRAFAKAVGAQPVELSPAQAPAAFLAGRFDALFVPVAEGLGQGQAKGIVYYDVGAWLPKNAVVMSGALYETLASKDQELLLQLAETAEARGWAACQQEYDRRAATLSRLGIASEAPSPALMQGLRDIGDELARDWLARAGFDGEDILRAYRS
jgi:TRAP-type C4-dicarboxylate transport system substrate-binding protein